MNLNGIHHVTAIAGDPQRNVDFYVGVLGLRLVKKTVNFDDSSTYHLYYGNYPGTPGTIVTFFCWPEARSGKPGVGETTRFAFQAPRGSLGFWQHRLEERGVNPVLSATRFGREYLQFQDPDGIAIEIVEADSSLLIPPENTGSIPPECALGRVDGITLLLGEYQPSARLLTEIMRARLIGPEQDVIRYELGDGARRAAIDLVRGPTAPKGKTGKGLIHHVAWDTPEDEEQAAWLQKLTLAGFHPSPVIDRTYFHSIYFREPGHVLFEIATTPPGFSVDETLDSLGRQLMLPPWLEEHRTAIEQHLPPIRIPLPV